MTDQEIIKALCHCRRSNWCDDECPYHKDVKQVEGWQACQNQMMADAAQHLQTLIYNAEITNNVIKHERKQHRKLRIDLTKQMSNSVSSMNKQIEALESQLKEQVHVWHPGSEYPSEEKPYLALILPSDVYGVPVSEKTCYKVVQWSVKYGWCMKHNGIVLYWQELPKEPQEEDD